VRRGRRLPLANVAEGPERPASASASASASAVNEAPAGASLAACWSAAYAGAPSSADAFAHLSAKALRRDALYVFLKIFPRVRRGRRLPLANVAEGPERPASASASASASSSSQASGAISWIAPLRSAAALLICRKRESCPSSSSAGEGAEALCCNGRPPVGSGGLVGPASSTALAQRSLKVLLRLSTRALASSAETSDVLSRKRSRDDRSVSASVSASCLLASVKPLCSCFLSSAKFCSRDARKSSTIRVPGPCNPVAADRAVRGGSRPKALGAALGPAASDVALAQRLWMAVCVWVW